MNSVEVLDIGRGAILTLLKVGAPIMFVALAVGLVIALFQALTQIQEMTLTFVPKIITIVLSLLIFLPFMLSTLLDYGRGMFDRISAGG